MNVVEEKIGNGLLYIASIEENGKPNISNLNKSGTNFTPVKAKSEEEKTVSMFESIRHVISSIASELKEIKVEPRPKEIQLEFSIGFSASLKAYILNVKGDQKATIKLKWD